MTYFILWLSGSLLVLLFLVIGLLWSIRSGQFSHQQRARYLPLQDGNSLPENTKEGA